MSAKLRDIYRFVKYFFNVFTDFFSFSGKIVIFIKIIRTNIRPIVGFINVKSTAKKKIGVHLEIPLSNPFVTETLRKSKLYFKYWQGSNRAKTKKIKLLAIFA